MELLSGKLNELEGSSAVIVSHDMHLSVTFADIIIKIRKEERVMEDVKDEVVYYGVIDKNCIFLPSEDRKTWSNGLETYEAADFELYLKKI